MNKVLAIFLALSAAIAACFFLWAFIAIFLPFLRIENDGYDLKLNAAGKIVMLAAFIIVSIVVYTAVAKNDIAS